jgi:Ala-tRNA(Pro) deacylase
LHLTFCRIAGAARARSRSHRPFEAAGLSAGESQVLAVLDALGIPYVRHEHAAASTVADAVVHWADIDAAHCKNLFLRNQKGDRHYLVILTHSKRADLRQVAVQIGDGKLSFASPERLMTHLGLAPGAVSPFGLLNDPDRHVRVFIDADLMRAERITFHPNINTVTLAIRVPDFERFLAHTGHPVRVISI